MIERGMSVIERVTEWLTAEAANAGVEDLTDERFTFLGVTGKKIGDSQRKRDDRVRRQIFVICEISFLFHLHQWSLPSNCINEYFSVFHQYFYYQTIIHPISLMKPLIF